MSRSAQFLSTECIRNSLDVLPPIRRLEYSAQTVILHQMISYDTVWQGGAIKWLMKSG